ncbi:MAG: FRG domain-containing protein [Desulfotalea sp.]
MVNKDKQVQEEQTRLKEEKHYLNLPRWPEFAVFDKTVDGIIPSCRVESWEDFDEVVKRYCDNDYEGNYVFRGQKDYRWPLEPTLDRFVKGAVKSEIATKHLEQFRLSIRGRLNDKSILNDENEVWALGQHHGLATPLLDWTVSPYVALFFAFASEDDQSRLDDKGDLDNYSRTIFILNKFFVQDLNDNGSSLQIVEPSVDDHGRLVNQAGLFTVAPYGETLESSIEKALIDSEVNVDDVPEVSQYICKIHIPNQIGTRSSCLKKLRKMNIHSASLFPDLIGASSYCNDLITEAILSERNVDLPTVVQGVVNVQAESDTIVASGYVSSSFTNHKLPSGVTGELLQALIVDESLQGAIDLMLFKKTVEELISFINEKAGVDWFKKESILARLRIIVRRSLKKLLFPTDFIIAAADALIKKAAMLSAEIDKEATK